MIMRETGKAKKVKGYREEVTYGFNTYTVPITDIRGITKDIEFKAVLKEMVPDYKECNTCKKYMGDKELQMAQYKISCKHEKCRETKINELVMTFDCDKCGGHWDAKPKEPYWTPLNLQEQICDACFGDIFELETGIEVSWYGVRLL